MSSWYHGKKPPNIKHLAGQVFGNVTAIEDSHLRDSGGSVLWVCDDGKLRTPQQLCRESRRQYPYPRYQGPGPSWIDCVSQGRAADLSPPVVEGGLPEYVPVAGSWWDPDEAGGGA
jgi:hypothetical protein